MASPESPPTPTSEVPLLPPRPETMHKGQAGRVAIIAGSRGLSGAAVLCGLGALRGGAGLVRVYTPASVHPIVAASEPSFMAFPLCETGASDISVDQALAAIEPYEPDVLAIGPGLGQGPGQLAIVQRVCALPLPLVLDADALNVLAASERALRSGTKAATFASPLAGRSHSTVITPHPGEMARLREAARMDSQSTHDHDTRLRFAHEYARYAGVTVVLKGHRTVVATADQAYVNTSGNAGMATGGMGDVLTGLIAALMGQGMKPYDAARLGVYVHGLAADQLANRVGPVGYLAREVAEAIPAAFVAASVPKVGFRA